MNDPSQASRSARGTQWLTALIAVLLMVAGILGQAERALAAWMICNACLAAWVAVAVVFHPGVLWRVRGTILRWAALVAIAGSLLLASKAASLYPHDAGGAFSLALALVLVPAIFIAGLGVGWLGGALAWWSAGGGAPRNRMIRHGISFLWVLLSTMAAGAALCWKFQPEAATAWASLSLGGIPFLTMWLSPAIRSISDRRFSHVLHEWMKRWLVFRGSTTTPIDLRVPVCALAAFVFASGLQWLGALDLLRYNTLFWLVRQRISYERVMAPYRDERARQTDGNATRDGHRVVLLTWDHAALYDAGVARSLHHVQADLVRQLTSQGVSQVVVPLAAVPAAQVEEGGEPDRSMNRSDGLAVLLDAARASGKVLFLLPPGVDAPEAAGVSAANQRGLRFASGDPGGFGLKELCSIPLRWNESDPPPVPWALLNPSADPSLLQQPLIAPGTLLVDFSQARHGAGVPQLPASAVLQEQPVPWKDESGQRRWTRPEALLRDRIVLLDQMDSTPCPSPLGEMSPVEIAAHATLTVMDRSGVRGSPVWAGYACALLLSLAAGHLSSRHGLLGGLVRMAVVGLLVFMASGGCMLFSRWFDPVFPSAAAMSAFLLVSQFTFILESRAKQEHRALLQRFVAPEVVSELLDDPAQVLGLRGRRERVIVLFADVRGFSRFAGEHSPEEVVRAINAYLHQMTDALNDHGGLLDKYTGDGLMALFRTGNDEAGAVRRAVAAALAMRDAVIRVSESRMAGGDRPLQVGIALHVGEAVVGLVGSPVHQINYTALGHAVVVAARLQAHAVGGEVLVTDAVHCFLDGHFITEERPPVSGKGLTEPVRCWSAIASTELAPVAEARV